MDSIEEKIQDLFEQNYQLLRLDGGHSLTEDVKELALNQVILYWRKLKDLAQKVTDAEVRLSLPNQTTPNGRTFSIEGVVDIVREGDVTQMYDIKTHDLDYVHQNKELYDEQLSIYTHIWQELRKNTLDLSAIISTAFPKEIKIALRKNDEQGLKKAIEKWEPIVPIEIQKDKLNATIESFGKVVDDIEGGAYECPSVESLGEKVLGTKQTFATKICSNCDARFSCPTYRDYARSATKGKIREFVKYFESTLDRNEQEDWLSSNSNFDEQENEE